MRIAYLSYSYIPSRDANSVHVMRMCEALTQCSQELVLLHPGQSRREVRVNNVNEFYGVKNDFRRIRIPELPMRGQAEVYGMLAARLAKWRGCELAYCRDIFSCLRALDLNIPAAFELHMPPKPGSKNERYLRKVVAHNRFVGLFVITDALKQEVLRILKLGDEAITVVPDAANQTFAENPMDLDTPGELQVGYVGSLLPGKGVEIIPDLAKKCPWAFFHVVGGEASEVLRNKEECTDLTNIRFHGFVPPGITGRYLAAFDVLLAPNQKQVIVYGNTDIGKYTSPLKIFEYMLAGKPIIASDIAVLKEVLRHDANSLLCDPGDVTQWVDALTKLRSSETLRMRLADTAKADALHSWTWPKRAEKILGTLGV